MNFPDLKLRADENLSRVIITYLQLLLFLFQDFCKKFVKYFST